MKLEIIKQEKNPFLEREEFTLKITNDVAPSFEEVKTELKKDAELTVVKKVNTNFGRQTFKVEAVVYDNQEAKNKVEVVPQKIRKKIEADKKAADEAAKKAEAEAKKAEEETKVAEAETPAEEVKEETPAEEVAPKEETKEEPAPEVAEEKTE